ncbi:unnamed protein product [Microthlaspi erraticum]|uniref:F-box domain-containing protein n=1 Tax=Microthlaspi erraticum TaxID=1685480 RepID=A0A6D2IB27_9BRAS|nr:unnamed protein product [Microthlaspi erraticum]
MVEKKNLEFRDHIPEDILLQILLRLPAKSLGRFVSVSKSWETIIRGRDFIRLFSSPSRFLLAFNSELKGYQENWSFFSRSTLVSPCEDPPCPPGFVAASRKVPIEEEEAPEFLTTTECQFKKLRYTKPSYVHGLIGFLYGDEQVVCNPTTGKSVTLPTVTVKPNEMIVRSFLGYDPVDARYKVLCLTNVNRFCEHQVFTLGSAQTQTGSWRMIQCSTPHSALGNNSVCIGGVLYYTASTSFNMKEPLLVGFDLRSETLEIASTFPEGIGSHKFHEAILINHHGKVALVTRGHVCKGYTFTLWVLEDAKKREWSKQVLCFPTHWTSRFHGDLEMVGASGLGEFEFLYAPIKFEELCVYFVDHKSNRMRRVQLQGNTKHKFRDFRQVFTFLHHVDSLMFT